MNCCMLRIWFFALVAVGALPFVGHAQEAAVSGTLTDSTGGVLPGVTVTAIHEAAGNTFVAVTDERGTYRLPVRIGLYRVTAELDGFAPASRTIEVLVGQTAVLNLQLAPSSVQESVTVTGEAPLIEMTSSTLSGNVDARQMEALPVNGRNWIDLAMLAPGNRVNAVTEAPVARSSFNDSAFQLNVDGQQVTNLLVGDGAFGQPRYSRDAIAEFEFISNRFDATQGRSLGVQVNAVTKSGTNTHSGTLAGYFRDDKVNAADFIQKRVLPYSNQQVSGTFGGPIRRDRIHFFGNYEYEREPQTFTYSSPFQRFNVDQSGTRLEHKAGARLDAQFSTSTRLSLRGNLWRNLQPYDARYAGGANRHPAGALVTDRNMAQIFGSLTQVVSNQAVNELKIGYAGFWWYTDPVVRWDGSRARDSLGAPSIQLRGYTIGLNYALSPQTLTQDVFSLRDDFSYSFSKAGRHDMKVGGEYLRNFWDISWMQGFINGRLDASLGAIPANIEDLFPVWNDPSTWNLAPLSPISRQYSIGVGNPRFRNPWHIFGGWAQDDWAVTRRLTLNLGVRYDLQRGAFGETLGVVIEPFFRPNLRADRNDVAPRLGFAYTVNDRTVMRGGFGQFFTQPANSFVHFIAGYGQQVVPPVFNDGRPDFASNPFNGPVPDYDQALANACDTRDRPGCFRRELVRFVSPTIQTPFSYQASIGVQRQLRDTISVSADYVFTGGRNEPKQPPVNMNLSYNPATGANYPFTDISKRPYPQWGLIAPWVTESWADYHALQTAFTKRFSQRWQASATYSLAAIWDGNPLPVDPFEEGCQHPKTPTAAGFACNVPMTIAPDLGGDSSLAVSDQRHRATLNGIFDVGYGFQLSGLYFFGSGERFDTSYGADLRNDGGFGSRRLRPDGTIVPRNDFVGKPIHRLDLRVQRRFMLGRDVSMDGMFEIYNAFNHANYGSYVTTESARNYGAPSAVQNVAYYPRTLQVGFRMAF